MWSLGKLRIKIQEASEDITKGGILLPSSKTTYIEANTEKGDETGVSGPVKLNHAPWG